MKKTLFFIMVGLGTCVIAVVGIWHLLAVPSQPYWAFIFPCSLALNLLALAGGGLIGLGIGTHSKRVLGPHLHRQKYWPLWPDARIVRVYGIYQSLIRVTFWLWWAWETKLDFETGKEINRHA